MKLKKLGLRPYVTYSCEYRVGDSDNNDFVITYTLDNYITIEGNINGTYYYDYGYLYNVDSGDYAIIKSGDTYTYDGITFSSGDTEEMVEYLGDEYYSYIKINGTKYYLDENYYSVYDDGDYSSVNVSATVNGTYYDDIDVSAGIFYIDSNGEKNYSQAKYNINKSIDDSENQKFIKYYVAIKHNDSAYEYYKSAYEFSKAVLNGTAVSGYTDKAGTSCSRIW